MQYKQLKHIIELIRKTLRCPKCNKVFQSEEIELVDIYDDEGIIDAACTECKMGVSVSVEMSEFSKDVPNKIMEQMHKAEITDSEVQDISRKLQLHKGGVADLFNPHS